MNAFADGASAVLTAEDWTRPAITAPAPPPSLVGRGFLVEDGGLPDGSFYVRVSRAGMLVEGRGDTVESALQRAAVLVSELEHVRSLVGSRDETPGDQRG